MLEPFRRVIDSAIPSRPVNEDPGATQEYLDQVTDQVVNASDTAKFAKPYPTDTSLENPLLGLTPQEYLAFKYVIHSFIFAKFI